MQVRIWRDISLYFHERKFIYTLFLYKQHFLSNTRLKLATSQAKPKQHPEAELLLFENYFLLYPCYHLKAVGDILKNVQKAITCV